MRRLHLAAIALVVVTTASPLPSALATDVLTVPTDVASDCSVDVSLSLGEFLSQVPDGSTVEFPVSGCFRVERQIDLPQKVGVVLNGNGTRLLRTEITPWELRYPKSNAFFKLYQWRQSTIRDLSIKGTNTYSDVPLYEDRYGAWYQSMEFDAGINVRGGSDLLFERLSVDAVYGDGIQIQRWKGNPTNVTIRDVVISRNGRQGISISAATNVLIDGVTITGSRRGGIDLEPDVTTMIVDGVEIRNSTINSHLLAIPAYGAGLVNNIYIHDNVIGRTGVPFIKVGSSAGLERRNWLIEGNTVTWGLGSTVPALYFANTKNVVINRNVLKLKDQSRLAVGLYHGATAKITNNWFQYALPSPAYVTNSGSSWVGGNNSVSGIVPPSAVNWTPPPRARTSVRRFDVREPAVRGARVRLTGRLLRARGDHYVAYAGVTVSVQFRPKGGTSFRTVKRVTTSSRGYVTAGGARAWRSGTWRVVFRGNTVALRSVSGGDYVKVLRG